MTFLADAGVTSLADLTGSVARGVTDLTLPVRVRTKVMTFLLESVVWNRLVFNISLYCDSAMDCGHCTSPDACCQGICDDLNCKYINYVGCDWTLWTELYWAVMREHFLTSVICRLNQVARCRVAQKSRFFVKQ